MLNVFLADLQNSYYRYLRNSVPIGMGFVGAYLQDRFGDEIRIHQFRKFEELYDTARSETPHLVAFGSYSWNTALTAKAAQFVRNRFPGAVIAVGGPDISQNVDMSLRDLRDSPDVDVLMPNEGEGPMRNLTEAVLGGTGRTDIRRTGVKGCLAIDPETDQVTGSVMSRFEGDINEIPSPYLTGLMDRFLDDPDYLPIIQTSRGCPYRCTFCVSGKDTWTKVKAFDMDRVKAEIDYVAEKASTPYMRFADENFGILRRDTEIADYLMRKRVDTGYPASVSIYTDKHPTDRVKEINLLMKDLMPFCISFQSMTKEVLDNIERINLKDRMVDDAVSFAREHDLLLVSELIFALPGETVDSFLQSIDQLLDLRFESIAINQLRILKGTAMDTPLDRETFQVKTLFAMSENGYTNHEALDNVEIDEWVVENSTMTREEYFTTNKFIFLFDFAHYRTFLKELLFFFETSGLRASRVLMKTLEMPETCPVINRQATRFVDGMQELLQDTPEQVVEHVRRVMQVDPDSLEGVYRIEDRLMIEVLMNGELRTVADEIAAAGRLLYTETHGTPSADWLAQLDLVCDVVSRCHVGLGRPEPETVSIEAPYDIATWVAEKYSRPLADYRSATPVTTLLRIRSTKVYEDLWASDLVLRDRHKRHFATVNSSNRRRHMARASAA